MEEAHLGCRSANRSEGCEVNGAVDRGRGDRRCLPSAHAAVARRLPLCVAGDNSAWDCQEFRARLSGLTDHSMAAVKRSPKRTANWDLAMDHSRGGMIHSFSEWFKTRKRSFVAASS